jgi:hypothetical protein
VAIAFSQGGGFTGASLSSSATSISRATASDVALGSLIVVTGHKAYAAAADAFVSGDVTVTGGTAAISGGFSFDTSVDADVDGGVRAAVGVWSGIVTTAGSLTVTCAGAAGACGMAMSVSEFTGTWDGSRLEQEVATSLATDDADIDTGNETSAGAALFFGAATPVAYSDLSITVDAAFTQIAENETVASGPNASAMYRLVGSGTTDSAAWTLGANAAGWSAVLAVYKEGVGGGASNVLAWITA